MPYQVWVHLPFQLGEPSSTQLFCASVSLAQAVSRGMPSASAWRIRSSWISFQAGVCTRSEEHTSELQSQSNLVCRLLLEKKKKKNNTNIYIHVIRDDALSDTEQC